MKIAWNLLVLVAACSNIYGVASDWRTGAPPDWFVWVSSIMFSIGVAYNCIKNAAIAYALSSQDHGGTNG